MISKIIKVEVRVISWSLLRHQLITLTSTMNILDITKNRIWWLFYYTLMNVKNWSHVSASSPMASNTKRANLTWLPLEIMHRGHTWHDYPWPRVSLTWLLYNLQLWCHRCWFWKFTVGFRPIRKELESSMHNDLSYQKTCKLYLLWMDCEKGNLQYHVIGTRVTRSWESLLALPLLLAVTQGLLQIWFPAFPWTSSSHILLSLDKP